MIARSVEGENAKPPETGCGFTAVAGRDAPVLLFGAKDAPKGLETSTGPELKGSVGEGPNQTNYSDRSSVRILSKI